jgi:hypothetical protein
VTVTSIGQIPCDGIGLALLALCDFLFWQQVSHDNIRMDVVYVDS